jgi:DNA-binding Lrp family transcriptional regulator
MDAIDSEILLWAQDGIGIEARPFLGIADYLGLDETEVIERLVGLKQKGIVRRFGSRVNPRLAGISFHAMVAWRVRDDRLEEVGTMMAENPEVTHCYERQTLPGRWDYNLYTVLHGNDQETVLAEIRDLSRETGVDEYLVLPSTVEFKRVPGGRLREGP